MNKATSLKLLHQWAHPELDYPPPAISMAERDARAHGAAAVRAIRMTGAYRSGEPLNDLAIRESRLAFRAALNAVGIKGAL